MSLNEEERHIVVNSEAEKARKTFAETEVLRAAGLWNNLAGRLYYAAFHAVSALLIHDHHTVGTHQSPFIMITVAAPVRLSSPEPDITQTVKSHILIYILRRQMAVIINNRQFLRRRTGAFV